ncbi:type II secretion system protein GspL [Methylomonas sp. SURF-2]|uniref:Type II secretion system protein L n=1 Tax=Methylomonas subterranea TaxID=2952225 RepID=A0ABT1TDZ6_9GAMM|nr:type II secretion system protein GspL [Methylomonas sp. SURF-2]MCQ8103509.1 type II secretion system protein GspL [Methylomonas sp. SURF-2]
MTEPILLRELSGPQQAQWLDLAAPADGVHVGGLRELAGLARERPLILVWPAASILLLQLDLPLRGAGQIAKALPYALEDSLALDVEAYHFSWCRAARDGAIAVAAVDRQAMTACMARFAAAGLRLSMALPEPLLLPWHAGECAMLLEGGSGVCRFGAWLGGGGEADLCGVLLEKLHADGQLRGSLQLWSAPGGADFGPLPVEVQAREWREPLALYAEQWRAATGLNLLVGAYAPPSRRSGSLKAWLPAALILLAALLAQLAGQWNLQRLQQQQLQALEADSEALFRQTFPEVKRLVNIKAQADQQLQALHEQSRHNAGGFLALLHVAGGPLMEAPQIRLQGLQFDGEVLRIKLLAPDAAGLEQFKDRLSGEGGTQADIVAATGVAEGVEAEIAIRQN